MRPEIKELYEELLKNKRTVAELKRRHQEIYEVKVRCWDISSIFSIERDFTLSGSHAKALSFLYPEEKW